MRAMRAWLLCVAALCLFVSVASADWVAYEHRYAMVVMGGDQSGQLYTYYWMDTSGMYDKLRAAGFADADVYFLAYGASAQGNAKVDRASTRDNVFWALDQLAARSTAQDLVYIFWVDHGSDVKFDVQGGDVTHAELGQKIAAITARQVLVALNPCRSGSALDDISRDGVCVTSSVKPGIDNSWGWAGQWITGLTGGGSSDTDGDGVVSFAEAYAWVAQKSHTEAPNEHPQYDDNGDKAPAEQGQASFSTTDANKDGYVGSRFGLGLYNRPRGRAYLDYLIARRGQSAATLSGFFSLNFASFRPSVVSQCLSKLQPDLSYQQIVFLSEDDYVVRQRQYLDYLILRRGQPASQLSSYFGKDFSSTDWDTMAWCTRKLEMDLGVQGTAFRTAAQVQSRDRAYLNYLMPQKGQSASVLTSFFKVNFDTQDAAELWTCVRLLEKDLTVHNTAFIARPQWEASGSPTQNIPLVAPH